MATKSRKSGKKDILMTTLAVAGGLLVGAVGVPKLVEAIDKEGKLDSKIVDGGTAVLGYLAAKNTKGTMQEASIGLAAGGVLHLGMNMLGLSGIPYPGNVYNTVTGYSSMPMDNL